MQITLRAPRLVALGLAVALTSAACSSSTEQPADVATADETEAAEPADTSESNAADPANAAEPADEPVHSHAATLEVTYSPVPTVSLEVTADPKSGWNVHAVPTGHRLAPERASTEPIDGEGHMHLYVDGVKVSRLYGEWFHLPALDPGDHEIRVELSANDHSALAVEGTLIDATVTVTETAAELVPMDDTGDMADTAGDADTDTGRLIAIRVTAGTVEDGGRHTVDLDSEVTIRVESDTADHVHVHGYDLFAEVTPDAPAELTFSADLPGVWEIELEDSGIPIAELEVS